MIGNRVIWCKYGIWVFVDGCIVFSVIGICNDEGCVEWVVEWLYLRVGINLYMLFFWVEGFMLFKSVIGGVELIKGIKWIFFIFNIFYCLMVFWCFVDVEVLWLKEDGNW